VIQDAGDFIGVSPSIDDVAEGGWVDPECEARFGSEIERGCVIDHDPLGIAGELEGIVDLSGDPLIRVIVEIGECAVVAVAGRVGGDQPGGLIHLPLRNHCGGDVLDGNDGKGCGIAEDLAQIIGDLHLVCAGVLGREIVQQEGWLRGPTDLLVVLEPGVA